MDELYSEFKAIEKKFQDLNEYKNLLNNIDYHFNFFTDMYFCINNFMSAPTSFKNISNSVSVGDKITLETIEKYFDNINQNTVLHLSVLLNNCKKILYSLRKCVEVVNISDAITLFRKFKDDLLLFIYFVRLGSIIESVYETEEKLIYWNNCVNDVLRWRNNEMKKVYYTKIINFLKKDSLLVELNNRTGCFNYIKILTDQLNNFAHSNGISFINNYNPIYNQGKMIKLLEFINIHLEKVSGYLLTMLFTISPNYLASTDYVDYMDVGSEPPDGCQYWIAPFYQEYIDKKLYAINPILKQFLIENTPMKIE